MRDPVCPNDGGTMSRGERQMPLVYKGERTTISMPGWYCGTCGESIHSGTDMKVSDRTLNLLKARVEGLTAPEEVRRIRQKLHLSQQRAGYIIGGGPRAFQKYESGDLLPSHAVVNILYLLDHKPENLSLLEQRNKAVHPPHQPWFGDRQESGDRASVWLRRRKQPLKATRRNREAPREL